MAIAAETPTEQAERLFAISIDLLLEHRICMSAGAVDYYRDRLVQYKQAFHNAQSAKQEALMLYYLKMTMRVIMAHIMQEEDEEL